MDEKMKIKIKTKRYKHQNEISTSARTWHNEINDRVKFLPVVLQHSARQTDPSLPLEPSQRHRCLPGRVLEVVDLVADHHVPRVGLVVDICVDSIIRSATCIMAIIILVVIVIVIIVVIVIVIIAVILVAIIVVHPTVLFNLGTLHGWTRAKPAEFCRL